MAQSIRAQTFQLFFETFDGPSSIFALNTLGPGGAFGPNVWTINNQYNGLGVYPSTPTQDSTFFGTINFAPTSNYLHIYDSGTASPTNATYDPAIASDNFAEVTASYCTLGLIDVTFSFFYTCDGTTNDFGEVYYSADGSPWTKVGEAKYNNKEQWQFEAIMDPGFNDVEDLRFGFRWVNDGSSPPNSTSFSVDDVVLVATYDPILNPVDITITSFAPDPVCQEDNLLIFWEISDPLCEGQYEIELSAPGGGFYGRHDRIGRVHDRGGGYAGRDLHATDPGLGFAGHLLQGADQPGQSVAGDQRNRDHLLHGRRLPEHDHDPSTRRHLRHERRVRELGDRCALLFDGGLSSAATPIPPCCRISTEISIR